MSFSSAVPVLPSLDIRQSCAFYVEKLGFSPHFVWEEDGKAPSYGGVQQGEVHLHFITVEDRKVCEWTVCRIYVDDIEDYYERAQAEGIVHPNGALARKPWGEREFAVLDPSGVCLFIVEEDGAAKGSGQEA